MDQIVDTHNPSWPKTEFGTVEWEVVFEDPETGYVPIVQRTTTPKELKDTTVLIVHQLFTRGEDFGEIKRFTRELTELIPDETPPEALPILQEAVTTILRQVKGFRVQKAEEYIREQAEKAEAEAAAAAEARAKPAPVPRTGDRRRTKSGDHSEISFLSVPLNKKTTVSFGVGLAAVIGVVVVALAVNHFSGPPAPNLKDFLLEMKAARQDHKSRPHTFGGFITVIDEPGKFAITANGIPPETCQSAVRALVRSGIVIINGYFSRQLPPKEIRTLCGRAGSTAQITWLPRAENKE